MLQAEIHLLATPTGDVVWRSVIPQATRNIKLLDDVLKQVALISCPDLPHYPTHRLSPNHQHLLYKLNLNHKICNLFGSVRAGATIFPHTPHICPACGGAENSTTHILRKCKSTRVSLNTWLEHISTSDGEERMAMSDQEFVKSIFDLHSFSMVKYTRTTISFIYAARTAARSAAIRRRDGS